MIIHVKNKSTLIIGDFRLKCCIGKNGLNSNKIEGDYTTPKGLFNLNKLYFREDRVDKPKCNLTKKIIKKSMAWCDDPNHTKYNEEIKIYSTSNKENFYRVDHRYDYIITISHNYRKVPGKGSAIFIHLTDDYKPTAGCIALKKKTLKFY